jgi:hypothetical protein
MYEYNYNDQVKVDEMSRACRMHGGAVECIWEIGRKAKRKETSRRM